MLCELIQYDSLCDLNRQIRLKYSHYWMMMCDLFNPYVIYKIDSEHRGIWTDQASYGISWSKIPT